MLRGRLVLIFALAGLGLLVLAFHLRLLPERHDVRDNMEGVTVFWREDEAWVFVARSVLGRRHSWLVDHAPSPLRFALISAGLEAWAPLESATSAYRVAAGAVSAFELTGTPLLPAWELEADRLVARPQPGEPGVTGFRWDGAAFVRVPPGPASAEGPRVLAPEDEGEGEPAGDSDPSFPPAVRARLTAGGWHHRRLHPYEAVQQAVELPMVLRDGTYRLALTASMPDAAVFGAGLRVSLRLSLPSAPEPRVLFGGGDWRAVGRADFERLAAASPAARARGDAAAPSLVSALNWVVGGALAAWLLLAGPTRGVKIAFVAFVLLWAVPYFRLVGARHALTMFAVPVAAGLVSLVVSARLVRHAVTRGLLPVGEDACPAHARARVEEWTKAFEHVGFRRCGDRQSRWWMMSAERKTFIRFLRQADGHAWAEIHALDSPRVVARQLTSIRGDTQLLTSDLQSNQELLREPRTVTLRVARSTHCGEMVAAHTALVGRRAGALRVVDDPVTASADAYAAWVGALRRSGQIDVVGAHYRVSLRAMLPVAARVVAAWFH
jgi:uncharacterized membrane protein (UPF0136 family)